MSNARNLADIVTGNFDVPLGALDNIAGSGMVNRIINGDMRIDQRNGGASVTSVNGVNVFCVDRWFGYCIAPAVFTMQQSTDAPSGFVNSVAITVTTQDTSITVGDFNSFRYIIEGLNVADFGWGTANAQSITLSFWVKSSLTGTFPVAFRNSAVNRSYIETYTISVANTWEQKTVTIAGDTSGTWLTTNGIGIRLDWSLGTGSNYLGTAGSWTSTNDMITSDSVNVVGTSGATFYITGVQLEKGSTATDFEYVDYGRQLQMCQRYFETSYSSGVVPGTANNVGCPYGIIPVTTSNYNFYYSYQVAKRASSTMVAYSAITGAINKIYVNGADVSPFNFERVGTYGWQLTSNSVTAGNNYQFQWTASAEL